jgi:hypothetical protein
VSNRAAAYRPPIADDRCGGGSLIKLMLAAHSLMSPLRRPATYYTREEKNDSG